MRANGFTFAKHVPNFPRIVLGHETLVDALGGMMMSRDEQQTERTVVKFGHFRVKQHDFHLRITRTQKEFYQKL